MTETKDLVVVMSYGSPASIDDVEAYYTDIRRGRPPSTEEVAHLVRRYQAIGGTSPLRARTQAQADGIQAALDAADPGRFGVVVGTKHASPTIEEAVAEGIAASPGAGQVIGLALAPHYSDASVGEYVRRLTAAAAQASRPSTAVREWAGEPAYIAFLAGALSRAMTTVPAPTKVIFTAHSLPLRALAVDDPYAASLTRTAAAVAGAVELDQWSDWTTAFQSAGRSAGPWLGPDLLGLIAEIGATGRAASVVVCPCGFVADHLEVLYDLDIEAAGAAGSAGLAFARSDVPNADPKVISALAHRVLDLAGAAET